jgi:parallel beta-helix repeat protein
MRRILVIGAVGLAASSAGAVGPAGYWRFEEPGGATVVDSGPNGLDGTLNGLPVRSPDIPVDPVPATEQANTQSLDLGWQSTTMGGRFNVVDPAGYLSMGDTSFTIEAWVRLDHVSDTSGGGQRQYLCQKKSNAGPDTDMDYAFLVQAGDLGSTGRELALRFADGATAMTQLSTLEIGDMSWHHVSVAYDADASQLRFGIDGTFETIPFAKPNHTNGGPLRVGAHQNSAGDHNQFLRGTIDEVRIAAWYVPVELLLDAPAMDCNDNGIPDVIDIADGTSNDCNGNCVPDECDIDSGASADCQGDGIPDDCQLDLFRYAWDDGEGDAAVRSGGTHMAWLSNFTVTGGFTTITHVDIAIFESVGQPATIYVWSDPNGDGDPTDATVLASQPFTIVEDMIDLNENTLIDIPDTFVGPNGTSFFVGVILDFAVTGDDFPARYDLDDPWVPGVSWVIGAGAPIDPDDLSAGAVEFSLTEDAGLPPGNWNLQAVVEGGDCNGNGVPDECDIDAGADDCNENGVPDECELFDNDCNFNGIVDECDIADGTSDDLDMDGVPDECPFAEICVPLQASTIQQAIVGGGDGSVITVKDGTYFEQIDFLGKALTVVSENGPATTIIDGGGVGSGLGVGSVVSFVSGEGPDSVLEGFTITGGSGTPGQGGGGIIVESSAPTIRGNEIVDNATNDLGGGILLFGSSAPVISDNVINDNSAHAGAAIHAEPGNSTVRIEGNQIIGNTAETEGGGVYHFNGTIELVGNEIADNVAGDSGGGLFVLLTGDTTPVVASNVFRNNQATDEGGAMWLDTTDPIVVNNLIVGNSAQNAGGAYLRNTGTFANNTVVDNTASGVGGGILDDGGQFTIVNSIIRLNTASTGSQIATVGGTSVTYSNVAGGFAGTGNIDADPLFVDPGSGDYRLGAGSPSVDAASNTALPPDAADLDDDGDLLEPTPLDLDDAARTADDPDVPDTGEGIAPIADMGAYERGLDCPSDVDGDGETGFQDLLLVLAAWGPCPGCPEDIDGNGLVDFQDLLIVLSTWGPC